MKKLYIIAAAALVSASAAAQTVNFTRNGEVLTNGTTLNYSEKTEVQEIDGTFITFTIEPEIYVVSDEDVNISLKAECTSGQEIQMCYGECMSGPTVFYNNIPLTANTPLATQFKYLYTIEFDDEGNPIMPTEPIVTELSLNLAGTIGLPLSKITVVMDPNDSSVSVLEADKSFSYTNGEIRYDAGDGMQCGLYDAEGKCVLDTRISGTGAISTKNLAPGIYVYRLGSKSGKIYVK